MLARRPNLSVHQIPRWIHPLVSRVWPGTLWSNGLSPSVHLTFDDGPHPSVTRWVLKQLDMYGMKATFFVVGNQAQKHPELLDEIRSAGHALGGHTMAHENGWRTRKGSYVRSAQASRALVSNHAGESVMFRPPYGRLTPLQSFALKEDGPVVMWDVLSGDHTYRNAKRPEGFKEGALAQLTRHTKPGSIVVFHDSEKHAKGLEMLLPPFLEWLKEQEMWSAPLEVERGG